MAKRKIKNKPQKEHYDLDIIIPVYGQPVLLAKCLASIEATKKDIKTKVILVDDCGPKQDELKQVYHSLNGNSRVVYHKQNQGFARSVNDGVALGNASFVLILNSDIELKENCLQEMLAEFADPKIGVVGPKLLFPEDSIDPRRPAGKVQHAGLAINIQGNIIHPNIGWQSDHPKVNQKRTLQAVTGACLMTRRIIWNEVLKQYRQSNDPTKGAMNEVYSLGTYEDVEFCFAARSLGYLVNYTPKAVAYHYTNASVVDHQDGYPIGRNKMIFQARCGHLLQWDEWKYN